MKKGEIKKMKEQENEHTIHTNEHEMYHGSPKTEKTQLEDEAYALLSFLQL
jgi:hypothetical protein